MKIGFTESGSKSVTEENNSLWFDVGEIENINPVILAILKSIYTVRNQIIKAVISNMFPDGINFDNAINNLKE